MTLLLVLNAWAGAADHIRVVDPYVRPLAPGQHVTAGYFLLESTDTVAHALIGVSSPIASAVELHTIVDEGGVKEMRPIPKVEIPAGGRATLAPTGNHLMIFGVESLAAGQTTALTLRFEDGTTITVQAPVQMLAPALVR
jgi:copper(I)-binding protein